MLLDPRWMHLLNQKYSTEEEDRGWNHGVPVQQIQFLDRNLVDHIAHIHTGNVHPHHPDLVCALNHVDELVNRAVLTQSDLHNTTSQNEAHQSATAGCALYKEHLTLCEGMFCAGKHDKECGTGL